MRVEILRLSDCWCLVFRSGDHILNTVFFARLIEAYQAAYVLKVHIDNERELPLRQYLLGTA